MQNCITSAILLSFLLIFGVRPSGAQTKAPSIYNAYTGTDVKVVPPAPAWGPANSVITDPTFGSRTLRVTDANTKGGESFISTDSGFSRAWSANSTAIKLTGPFGDGYWMEFNPSNFHVGAGSGEPVLHPVSFGATWEWSAVQPNIIYYLSGSTIETYNTTSGASTPVASTPTGDPVTYTAAVIGLDNWVCTAAGAGPQDTYSKIFCVSPSNPSLYKFIDVVNKTINGAAQTSSNWPTSAAGETIGIHDISGGTGPNWLEVTFHQQSWGGNGGAVFDLSTNTWSLVTNADPYWSGHVSMGNGRYENSSGSINGDDSRGIVLRDPDNLMNSSEYLFVMQPLAPWNRFCDADHSSWLNSLTNPNAPILDSRYSAGSGCPFAWSDEIVAAAVDGSNTVWRFAHNFNGGSLCYYAQAFAQISNDGNWALFSSYWGGTLGPDKSFGCATRIDTFIVNLKDAGLPAVNSVSPNSGAGASRTFTFQYSSPAGYGYLSQVHALLNTTLNGTGACWVYYIPASNSLYLVNDAYNGSVGPLTPGSAGTLTNSQCTLNGTGSTVTGAGNTLTMTVSLNFSASFTGLKTYYGLASDGGNGNSGWQSLGTWYTGIPPGPTANYVSPNSGGGASQTFTFQYSSVNGYGYLSQVHALLNTTLNGAGACWVYYLAASNSLYLVNDAYNGSVGPLTPGSAGTLTNSQCTLNGTGSTITGAGNTLTMTLSLNFSASFAGLKTYYGLASDGGNGNSGWQSLGTWYTGIPPGSAVNSVSPNSGGGASRTFTFQYSSPAGYGYLSQVHALLNTTLNGTGACWVYYIAASNSLYLVNDAYNGSVGPLTPGSAGTLTNSQCTLNGTGSTITDAGNTLTMTLSLNFSASFTGLKTYYGLASDDGNGNSGWQSLGTWTPH